MQIKDLIQDFNPNAAEYSHSYGESILPAFDSGAQKSEKAPTTKESSLNRKSSQIALKQKQKSELSKMPPKPL